MCLRLAFALMLPGVLATSALAQQTITDVVVQGASMNDAYGGGALTCGVDGQIYRHPSGGGMTSVMRISPDGSTLLFTLPEHVYPGVIAPAGTGLKILSSVYSSAERRSGLQMFHFDNLANLLAQNSVVIPIEPSAMAALPSGRTIVVGSHLKDPDYPDDRKYSFVILDENDELWKSVDLPLPPGGGGWTFIGIRMASRDGVAYVMLHSNQPPQTALATIAEKGNQNLDIKVIAAPFDSEVRHHNEWLFGPGVVVDLFHYTNERPHVTARFDEYDLKTGEKIATKSALPTGFGFGCYLGNEFIMLVPSAHEDPVRHLSPETLRLVTTKLRVDEASSPSATDKPH